MSRDGIKYLAAGVMFLNHIANVFLQWGTLPYEVLVDVGYFTAVTMIYFLTEGYEYTRSHRKYALRLLVFAVLSQFPFSLAFTREGVLEFVSFNMLFTLLACFGIIHILKNRTQYRYAEVWVVLLAASTCFSDWGGLAPVITILFVRAEKKKEELKRAWLFSAFLFGIINFADGAESFGLVFGLCHAFGSMLPMLLSGVCILHFYNGRRAERGRKFSKWFFYLFYPAHLLILGILRLAIL